MRQKGWTYLGAKRAESVSPFKQAVAFEVYDARNPDLSTHGLGSEEAAIAFHRACQHCREQMLRGETDLRSPAGTWAMVQHFGQCSSPLSTAA